MKVVFASLPIADHVHGLMALAEACRAAGHEAVLATGEPFGPRLRAQGWQVRSVEVDVGAAIAAAVAADPTIVRLPPPQKWRMGVATWGDALPERTTGPLLAVLDELRPDLVVYEETNLGAALAAGLAGVPAVRHGLGPELPPQQQDGYAQALAARWSAMGGTPPEDLAVFGVAHVDRYPQGLGDAEPAAAPQRLPMRPDPWEDDLPQPDLGVLGDRLLVHLTLGTVAASGGPAGPTGGPAALTRAADALLELDVDVLVTVGAGGDLDAAGPARSGLRVERTASGREVLARAAIVVHSGFSGDALGAFSSGVPQLVLPQGHGDQFLNAAAVARGGSGLVVSPWGTTAADITETAGRLLHEEGFRTRAAEIAQQVAAMPAPSAVVTELERLVAA